MTYLIFAAVALLAAGGAVALVRHRRALRDAPRRCRDCARFDLAGGQLLMDRYPQFRQAAAWVPPSEMGRRVAERRSERCPKCSGTGVVGTHEAPCLTCGGDGMVVEEVLSPPSAALTSRWEDFGLCNLESDPAVLDGNQVRADRDADRAKKGRASEPDCWTRRKAAAR